MSDRKRSTRSNENNDETMKKKKKKKKKTTKHNVDTIRVASIVSYPIKSCGGIQLKRTRLTKTGIEGDRMWMFVDEKGRFVSQRKYPRMALIRPEIMRDGETNMISGVTLKAGTITKLIVPITKKRSRRVTVWGTLVSAYDQGDKAASWIDRMLCTKGLRLVFLGEEPRPVGDDEKYALTPAYDQVSFSDGYPLLLISEESLSELNRRLGKKKAVPMNRFRPNITVRGVDSPHAEDRWQEFQIGPAVMSGVKKCQRCRIPTTDQDTGVQAGFEGEPLKTLRTYRCGTSESTRKGVFFGQNVIHHRNHISWLRSFFVNEAFPMISVGDPVVVKKIGNVPES